MKVGSSGIPFPRLLVHSRVGDILTFDVIPHVISYDDLFHIQDFLILSIFEILYNQHAEL